MKLLKVIIKRYGKSNFQANFTHNTNQENTKR